MTSKHQRKGKTVVSNRAKKSRLHYIGTGERVKGAQLREAWNSRLSVAQNYANLGLASKSNESSSELMRTRELAASTEPANLIFADVPRRSIAEQKRARKHKKSSIPEETAEYIEPLMAKYGTAYAKMRNDIKLNRKQMNTGWLRKWCEKSIALSASAETSAAEEAKADKRRVVAAKAMAAAAAALKKRSG